MIFILIRTNPKSFIISLVCTLKKGISLTSSTPPHYCSGLNPGHAFPTLYIVVFFNV